MCLQARTNDTISPVYSKLCPNEEFSSLSKSERLSEAIQEVFTTEDSTRSLTLLEKLMTATIPAILRAALQFKALQ